MSRNFSVVFLLGALGVVHAADKIVGGPYVVNPTARTATIGWVVETSAVRVGDEPGKLNRSIPVLRSEKVSLTGLKPGTTVHYRVPVPATGATPAAREAALAAAAGYFKTPPTGRANFRFVVFGDTRTRHDLHQRVVTAIAGTNPDFVVHTGDLVSDGYDTSLWPLFFTIERELLRKTVFFPVLGNHERNNRRFHEFFDVASPYYAFNWGSAHFIILDSDVANVSTSSVAREAFWNEQIRWFEDDLAKSQKADFRFVVMHHPPYTAYQKASHMSPEALSLVPLFEKYHVSAVLAGHDHNYQHHLKNGIHYIVTGGGGAPLAPVDQPIPGMTLKVESIEHYLPVQVEGDRAHIQAIALDGRVIDTIELGPAPATAPRP